MSSSPDTSGYLGLTLYDANEQDLIDTGLTNAQAMLPEWEPREGNTEVVLLESLALVVAEVVFALNRLSDTTIDGVLALYGLTRDPGAPPTGRVEFTLADDLGHTIPAGTTVRATVDSTGELVDLTTDEPLEILAGVTTGTVTVTGVDVGVAGNGVPVGTVLELIDAVAYVDTVTLTIALAGGREVEDDPTFFNRGATLLSRLVSTLVLPDHFTAAALENAGVGRATTLDLYNADAGSGAPGDHPGHVTVAVADLNGAPLSADVKGGILTDLTNKSLAGLTVHVTDPSITPVDVSVTITVTTNDAATVQAAVQAAITAYLSPATYAWDGSVWRNELIALIDGVAGVGRVVDLATPAADVDLPGYAALPTPGTITVTVQ